MKAVAAYITWSSSAPSWPSTFTWCPPISAFKAVAFPMPNKYDTVSSWQYHNPSGHVEHANIWRCFWFQPCNVYDCSPSTWMTSASSWCVFRSGLWRVELLHTCTSVGTFPVITIVCGCLQCGSSDTGRWTRSVSPCCILHWGPLFAREVLCVSWGDVFDLHHCQLDWISSFACLLVLMYLSKIRYTSPRSRWCLMVRMKLIR